MDKISYVMCKIVAFKKKFNYAIILQLVKKTIRNYIYGRISYIYYTKYNNANHASAFDPKKSLFMNGPLIILSYPYFNNFFDLIFLG